MLSASEAGLRARLALSFLPCIALVGACSSGVPGQESCTSNRDCAGGFACVSGSCIRLPEARACAGDPDCGLGETCDPKTGACVPASPMSCIDDTTCSADRRCDTLSGACVPREAATCQADDACDPPKTICTEGQCAPGCTRPDALACPAGQPCDPNTGRCVPAKVCASDGECGAPVAVCVSGACVAGCGELGGLRCEGGDVCDTSLGRCVSVAGPCTSDRACGAPDRVCESGQCVPGCGHTGGVQCTGATICSASSGRCEPSGSFCTADAECNPPATICNANTGACEPGCATTGCPSGSACDAATGRCASPPTCTDDAEEDDDTPATAGAIAPGMTRGLSACPGDDDHFALTLAAGETLAVDLTFSDTEGDLDVDVLDASGAVRARGQTRGANEHVSFAAPSAGSYDIRVYLASDRGSTPGSRYMLQVAVTPAPCRDDAIEENDDAGSATPIGPGVRRDLVACPSDDDDFELPLTAGDQVTVNITFTNAEGDIDVRATGPDGGMVGMSATQANGESLSFTAPTSGDHLVRVYLYDDDGAVSGNTYTLEVTVTPAAPTCTDPLEENDSQSTAHPLSAGPQTGLSICSQDDDYYLVQLAQGDRLSVRADFVDTEGDMDVELLSAAGARLASSTGVTNTESFDYTATAAGPVTIRAWLYAEDGTTPGNTYDLSVALSGATACAPDAFEPNNSTSAAAELELRAYTSLAVCAGDDDYYAVTLAANDRIRIHADFVDAEGDVDVSLISPSGTALTTAESSDDDEDITYTVSLAGVYLVRVYLYGDAGTQPGNTYDLTLSR